MPAPAFVAGAAVGVCGWTPATRPGAAAAAAARCPTPAPSRRRAASGGGSPLARPRTPSPPPLPRPPLARSADDAAPALPIPPPVGVILLAGGTGSRMRSATPKQFLPLAGTPILRRSAGLFLTPATPGITHLTVVLDAAARPAYADLPAAAAAAGVSFAWAAPGDERQASVVSGLASLPAGVALVAVHDAARPCVTAAEVRAVVADAAVHGAAVLGVPVKATVKEAAVGGDGDGNGDGGDLFVARTLDRGRLWEAATPQVVERGLLERGFAEVRQSGAAVTDDVSVVEAVGGRVKLTRGEYTNLKITTPEDMLVAEAILAARAAEGGGEREDVLPSPSTPGAAA